MTYVSLRETSAQGSRKDSLCWPIGCTEKTVLQVHGVLENQIKELIQHVIAEVAFCICFRYDFVYIYFHNSFIDFRTSFLVRWYNELIQFILTVGLKIFYFPMNDQFICFHRNLSLKIFLLNQYHHSLQLVMELISAEV